MYIFNDYYNNEVKLSFEDHPFSRDPKHVLILCTYKNQWLLTKHSYRGIEFPGGKVEKGESAEEAAIREIKEETGGITKVVKYLGQYFVVGKGGNTIKNVYFADIEDLVEQSTYYETEGPVLLDQLPDNIKHNNLYSFIMKDGVVTNCMNFLSENWRSLS
ncbi:RNA deprotection pyrophosphohydrolase [Virgibacillus byunsanensis]|uniref:RNA deprotection pyrophosphohydrolase n=1 Tax=Virgibacillus byunsanensis TaxID=570945 RepID=A0ABW3LR77_9BACI